MAEFNPPDSHWAADFDARLAGTFQHLLDRVESLEGRVAALEEMEKSRAGALAQAVLDMKHYAEGK